MSMQSVQSAKSCLQLLIAINFLCFFANFLSQNLLVFQIVYPMKCLFRGLLILAIFYSTRTKLIRDVVIKPVECRFFSPLFFLQL